MVGENTRANAMQIPEPAESVVIVVTAAGVATGVSVATAASAVNAATALRAAAATIEIAEKIARAAERRAATGASVATEVAPAPNGAIAKHVDREAAMSRLPASTNKVVHAKRLLGPTKVPVAAI